MVVHDLYENSRNRCCPGSRFDIHHDMWHTICALRIKNTWVTFQHYATGEETIPADKALPYVAEIVAFGGTILGRFTIAKLSLFLFSVAIQVYKAVQEEKVLEETIPAYSLYKATTKRFIPSLL
jgi:hypothetical protein